MVYYFCVLHTAKELMVDLQTRVIDPMLECCQASIVATLIQRFLFAAKM